MLDLLIVLAFVIYSTLSGIRNRKIASTNLEEYFLAGRSLSGWRAGVSMAATQFAADTPLLVMGLIATGGLFSVWRLSIYGLAFLMMGFIFASRWRRSRVLTDAELCELRYSGKVVLPLRAIKALYYGVIINCAVMAMVLVAAMGIAEVFLPWHLWLPGEIYRPLLQFVVLSGLQLGESVTGLSQDIHATNSLLSILAIVAFTTIYSTVGGLRSVVTTDLMQFSLAIFGTALYALYLVFEIGGLTAMHEKLIELYGMAQTEQFLSFRPTRADALWSFLILISLQWLFQMNSDGTGYLAQRSIACRTDADARQAAIVFSWLQIVLRTILWLIIACALLVLYPFTPEMVGDSSFVASREILFVSGINDYLPLGVRGIMLTALLAALASTIDTHLNWGASYLSNDIYGRLYCEVWKGRQAKPRQLVLCARFSNGIILLLSMLVMSQLGSIQTAWHISLLFGAGMGSVLVLRWLWERINAYSELAAMQTSLLLAPILLNGTEEEWLRLLVMAVGSTASAIAAAYLAPQTSTTVLEDFYKKVRPSGFWVRTERALGERGQSSKQLLKNELKQIAFSAGGLFFSLVGLTKFFLRDPNKSALTAVAYTSIGLLFLLAATHSNRRALSKN